MAAFPVSRLVRALRRPPCWIPLGVLALLAIARIALPYVLVPVLVAQADQALQGRIDLADLDLSLLRGGVTLRGLAIYTDELPNTSVASGPAPAPPLLEARRVWAQISWLALLSRTIRIEEFELEQFAVNLERTADGIALPRPVPSEQPAEPEPEPEEGPGWSFAADSIALREGEVALRDHTLGGEPQRFAIDVQDLSASSLALSIDPTSAEPGHIELSASIGDGTVAIDARIQTRPEGTAVRSEIAVSNLSLDEARPYLGQFAWSDLQARLDARIAHRFETGGAHELTGSAALSGLSIALPDVEKPVLAFERLDIGLQKVDLAQHSVALGQVRLDGARLSVDARARTPVLLLTAPQRKPPAAPAPAPAPAAEQKDAPAEPAPPSKPWTWRIAGMQLERATVDLLGKGGPLAVGVKLQVRDLSSERASRWPIALALTQGKGRLAIDGALAADPLAFDGTLAIAQLSLPPLLARSGAEDAGLLRKGTARADLRIALAPGKAQGKAPAPADLRVSGTLGIADLDVGEPATEKEFAAAWKDLELQIDELSAPQLLGADPAAPRRVDLALARVHLIEPAFRITREPGGVVLPALGKATAASTGKPAARGKKASQPQPAAPAPEIAVTIADARIDAARASILDRAVQPVYRSKIEHLDLRGSKITWPGPKADQVVLAVRGLNGAKLDAKGRVGPESKLALKLEKLPLAQFNAYVSPTGYTIGAGSISLEAQATVAPGAYELPTGITLSRLDLGGAEGASRFQQNFGIPLSMALGLLKDLNGDITLQVPIAGDRDGTRVSVLSVVRQSLQKALLGALSSPLKLLGAITSSDGKVESLAPGPIAFVAGSDELTAEGRARIEELAKLLGASPGIALTLTGGSSEDDVRVLEERALLAELQASSGARALTKIGQIRTRRAVREHLEAKLAGQPAPELDAEQSAWLEKRIAEHKPDRKALAALARKRAEVARGALLSGSIAAERLALGLPDDQPADAPTGVEISIGSPEVAAPQP